MKLLLDEHLPHRFCQVIVGHDVYTVAYMGRSGVENGELLHRAELTSFDAVITNDSGAQYEQDLSALLVAVVFLIAAANTLEVLRPLIPELIHVLTTLKPRRLVTLGH